jgi:hypothetical protein
MATWEMTKMVVDQSEYNLPPRVFSAQIQTTCDQFIMQETRGGVEQEILRTTPDEAYRLVCRTKKFLEGYVGADVILKEQHKASNLE